MNESQQPMSRIYEAWPGEAPLLVSAARRLGLSRRQLQSDIFEAPFRGIRQPRVGGKTYPSVTGDGTSNLYETAGSSLRKRAYSFLPRLGPDQWFSHETALALWGLPVPPRFDRIATIDVQCWTPTRSVRSRGVIGHQCVPGSVTVMDIANLRVVDPVSALRQCAANLTLDELVVLGDSIVCRQRPLATVEQLESVATMRHGRGIIHFRTAVGYVRAGTDSPQESLLRLALVRGGMPEPSVNHPVLLGTRQYFVDLAFPDQRLAVEYDGDHHRTNERQYYSDIDRFNDFSEAGWIAMRFNRSHSEQEILRRVSNAFRQRAAL